MYRLWLQCQYLLQGFLIGLKCLLRNGRHQIHIDIGKARFHCHFIGLQKIRTGMDPAKGFQFSIVGRLQADTDPVNSAGTVGIHLFRCHCSRVHLHADLTGIRKDKAAFQRFHNAYCLFGQKYRRGPTANKNRHHLILPVFRRCLLYFTAQCLYILLLHVRTLRPGQEITVKTFPYTKWYMKIQAQILFHLFIIQL